MLQFQLDQTNISIKSLSSQKSNRLNLLKTDIIELADSVLSQRLIIDDKEKERVDAFKKELQDFRENKLPSDSDIEKLVTVSLNHMRDLKADVVKFDSQIEEAKVFAGRNYDIGDLVGDLHYKKII